MIDINLMPWREIRRQQRRWIQGLEILTASLMAVLLLASFHAVLLNQVNRLQKQILNIQSSLLKVNQGLEEIKQLYQSLNYQQLPSLELADLLKEEGKIIYFLLGISKLLPERLRLQELHFDKGLWLIDGIATSSEAVLLFSERLKKNMNKKDWREALKNEKKLKLMKKQDLFYFQIHFEPD